ncbi:MAG TPA: glycosyltransferase family 4 protein [Longimicrobiales bacterium]|nr:glycosyltransferase family 4 protein [Longimicrobiales bacterium]
MRICYLCADRGIPVDGHKGASAHVRGLVRAFARQGHQVVVVTAGEAEPSPARSPLAETAGVVEVVRTGPPALLDGLAADTPPRLARALGHVWTNGCVEQALEAVIDRWAPDLLYERYSPFSIAGGTVARRRGIPHILEVNAPLAKEGQKYRRQSLQEAAEALERSALTGASSVVAVSAELRDLLVDAGLEESTITVVPNGVDLELFNPAVSPVRLVPADRIAIGFAGSLKPWHGLEQLCDAFRMADDDRLHLVVIGDGPAAGVIRELAEELPGRVTLTGAIAHDRVPEYLRGLDIAVAPYPPLDAFYFSPLKLLEYMAVGLPVIASSIGQVPELVADGGTGILVPPGDPAALADAIGRLAGDPARRNAFGARAAEQARAHHGWERRATTIIELMAIPA